jgi:hypothetical protein
MPKQTSTDVKSGLLFILKDFSIDQIAVNAELRDEGEDVILHFLYN